MSTTAALPKIADVKQQHLEVIKEYNINVKDLPEKLRKGIQALSMQAKAYEKNPTENRRTSITSASATLGNAILSWVEREIPDEGLDDNGHPNPPEGVSGIKSKNKPAKPDDAQAQAAAAVKAKLDADGKIYHDDLKKILNVRSLDDELSVGDIKLIRRVAFYYKAE